MKIHVYLKVMHKGIIQYNILKISMYFSITFNGGWALHVTISIVRIVQSFDGSTASRAAEQPPKVKP